MQNARRRDRSSRRVLAVPGHHESCVVGIRRHVERVHMHTVLRRPVPLIAELTSVHPLPDRSAAAVGRTRGAVVRRLRLAPAPDREGVRFTRVRQHATVRGHSASACCTRAWSLLATGDGDSGYRRRARCTSRRSPRWCARGPYSARGERGITLALVCGAPAPLATPLRRRHSPLPGPDYG